MEGPGLRHIHLQELKNKEHHHHSLRNTHGSLPEIFTKTKHKAVSGGLGLVQTGAQAQSSTQHSWAVSLLVGQS